MSVGRFIGNKLGFRKCKAFQSASLPSLHKELEDVSVSQHDFRTVSSNRLGEIVSSDERMFRRQAHDAVRVEEANED